MSDGPTGENDQPGDASEPETVEPVTAAPDGGIKETAAEEGLDADEVEEQFGDAIAAPVVPELTEEEEEDDRRAMAAYGGWAYLAFLFAVFLALALIAYGCDDDGDGQLQADEPIATTTTTEAAAAELTPVDLQFDVDGSRVTLRGAVPDEGARAQLIELAIARYGDGNVVDELTVDPETTLSGGTVTVSGSTLTGDENPEGLQADAMAALGLDGNGLDVTFEEIELEPSAVVAAVATDKITLTGSVPDQATVDGMVEAAERLWGADNVDATGLTVDSLSTLAGSSLNITGTADAGDTRVNEFAEAASAAFGVAVDNQSEVDTSAEALGRLEDRLAEELAANPINFETGSTDITAESDAILEQAAAAINAAPGIAVEVVGHTDDQGAADANQELSEERAQAVLDRLVELGVEADRLTARGAGEDEPIADNGTAEGRAENRRIVFEFEGAADDSAESDDDESE